MVCANGTAYTASVLWSLRYVLVLSHYTFREQLFQSALHEPQLVSIAPPLGPQLGRNHLVARLKLDFLLDVYKCGKVLDHCPEGMWFSLSL